MKRESTMAFFDNFSKKVQDVAFVATEKAQQVAAVAGEKANAVADKAKTEYEMASERRSMDKNYRAIGEWFISEYTGEIPDAVKDVVAAVNASKARIAEMEAEKASKSAAPANEQTKEEENAVSVKVCPVCGAASEDKFCPHCGAPMGE